MPVVQWRVTIKVMRLIYGLLGFFAVLGVAWLAIPTPALQIENIYSRGLFPTISFALISITEIVPFSIAGAFLVLVPTGLVIALVVSRLRPKHRATRARTSKRSWLWRAPLIGLAIYGLFITLWGANYRRLPIEEILNLNVRTLQATDLEGLAQDLLETIKRDANATRDEPGALKAIRAAVAREVQRINGVNPKVPTRVKATPPGLLLILETSGVVSPLTLEAHVDGALPPPFFLAVAAHELVHTTGFAGEADTDLIAAIAGLNSSDAYARYSVALWYFLRVLRDLPSSMQQRLWKEMPKVALEDYQALRKVTDTYQFPFVAQVSQIIYNQYLQTQGVEEGVRDYSRIGRLLAAARVQGRVFSK
jgi:uncharacterized membrane protein (GlpM family)